MPVQRGFIPGPMGGPYPGPQGGIQGFGPAGAQGFQQPVGSQLVEGINKFVANFRDQTEKNKEIALKKFMTGIELKEKGIPQDDKKLAKWAKEADLAFDYKGQTPMEKAQAKFEADQQAFQQQQQAAMGGMMAPQLGMNRAMEAGSPIPGMMPQMGPPAPGQMGMPPGAVMQGRPMPAPNLGQTPLPGMLPQMQAPAAGPPQRQPGMMSRIGQALGMGQQGPIPADAGIMQALQRIGQQGQQKVVDEEQEAANKRDVQTQLNALFHGTEKQKQQARDMLRERGAIPQLAEDQRLMDWQIKAHPEEDPTTVIRKVSNAMVGELMGVPEMQRLERQAAYKAVDEGRFDNPTDAENYYRAMARGQKPPVEPQRTIAETAQIQTAVRDLRAAHPDLGYYEARFVVESEGTDSFPALIEAVTKTYRTASQIEGAKWREGHNLQVRKMAQDLQFHIEDQEAKELDRAIALDGRAIDDLAQKLNDPKLEESEKLAVLTTYVSKMNGLYNLGWTVERIKGLLTYTNTGKIAAVANSSLSKMLNSQTPPSPDKLGPLWEAMKKDLAKVDIPTEGLDGFLEQLMAKTDLYRRGKLITGEAETEEQRAGRYYREHPGTGR